MNEARIAELINAFSTKLCPPILPSFNPLNCFCYFILYDWAFFSVLCLHFPCNLLTLTWSQVWRTCLDHHSYVDDNSPCN